MIAKVSNENIFLKYLSTAHMYLHWTSTVAYNGQAHKQTDVWSQNSFLYETNFNCKEPSCSVGTA